VRNTVKINVRIQHIFCIRNHRRKDMGASVNSRQYQTVKKRQKLKFSLI